MDLVFNCCLNGFMGLSSLLPLFQIIRKVVRQIDSSGADDTQEHEEVIAEGPLEDPSEVDADTDSFMKLAQVLRWLQPLGGSVCQGARPLSRLLTCVPALGIYTVLPPSGLPIVGFSRPGPVQCHSFRAYFLSLSLCVICPAFCLCCCL